MAIVGGGIAGCSAALHAAEAGARVVLVEANEIGWGASSRNAGHLPPATKPAPDEISARDGAAAGQRLIDAADQGPVVLAELIQRHGIECDYAVPGIIMSAREGVTVRLAPALVQPFASEDVADAVARIAVQAPANDTVEISGPEREPLSDLAQRFMRITQDPRKVISDVHARYFGAELKTNTLVPEGEAWQGAVNFERWMEQSEFARSAPRT